MTAVHGGDTVWLRASIGRHLTVENNRSVHAFSDQRGYLQAFVIEKETNDSKPVLQGDAVFLKGYWGEYLWVKDQKVSARKTAPLARNRILIEKAGGREGAEIYSNDIIYFMAQTGNFISVNDGQVIAELDRADVSEAFLLESDNGTSRGAHSMH
jgi:hypothetical protein